MPPDNRPPAPACQLEESCSTPGRMNIRLTIRLGPFDIDHFLVACQPHYTQALDCERPIEDGHIARYTTGNPLLVQSEKSLSLNAP